MLSNTWMPHMTQHTDSPFNIVCAILAQYVVQINPFAVVCWRHAVVTDEYQIDNGGEVSLSETGPDCVCEQVDVHKCILSNPNIEPGNETSLGDRTDSHLG